MENNYINYNPWIGLETYKEGQRLYGREDDIHALSQNILFNIQTYSEKSDENKSLYACQTL